MKSKQTYSELALIVVTIIWGLGFPITKLAFNYGFDAYMIMGGRFITAALLLSIVFYRKLKCINKEVIIYGVITGIFLFLGFLFQTLGNEITTASKNGFITQLNIVFVPFLYYLFFKKKVDLYNIMSVVIATVGLYVLSFGFSFISIDKINLGDFYTFICAIMIAFNVVTGSYFQKKHDLDPATFVLFNIYISTVLSIIVIFIFSSPVSIGLLNYWPLLFLGVLNTALGFLVQSYALKFSLPTRVSLIVVLESVFGVIGSILIIQEVLTVSIVVGGLLIIFGVLITELKPFKKLTKDIEIELDV